MTISTKPFEMALSSLKRSIDVVLPLLKNQHTPIELQETLRAGVIQHFEICYELAWKMLKRKLESMASDSARISTLSYQDLMREGAQKGLITDVEKWMQYRHQRNLTSHTYHLKTAEEVFDNAVIFYDDAIDLLKKLND